MTIQDWGALGELVGGIAIIVSLIYVGLQIRQGTTAAQSATNQAFSAQYSEVMFKLTEPDFREIWWRGKDGLKQLKGSEQAAYIAFIGAIMRMYESFHLQRKAGTFDPQLFDSWMNQAIDLFGLQGARDYWEIRRHQFTPEFVEYLEAELANRKPQRMYDEEAE